MGLGQCDIGLVGLGVMGRNLALNLADHGFAVAGFDVNRDRLAALTGDGRRDIRGTRSLAELAAGLKAPRAVLLMLPAGPIVDQVIRELALGLSRGDVIIDGGNSHFTDTERRARELAHGGPRFLGLGISGGSAGARHGPSLMPGGPREAYEQVRHILEAVAAKAGGEPCVAWLGPRAAGHYVKMVHNGIEYGLMELIAESYDLMRRGLGIDNDRLSEIYRRWNSGPLEGFLVEITSRIFLQPDNPSGQRLVDVIRDEAGQKGTGAWTSQSAMELKVPVPTIDMAVMMRNLSQRRAERDCVAATLAEEHPTFSGYPGEPVAGMERAMLAATVATYAQGFALLSQASDSYAYGLRLADVARIWRGGCIIRMAILEDIRAAYSRQADLPSLLADGTLAAMMLERITDLRAVVAAAATLGVPMPGLGACLAYIESLRSRRLPANLIQAQRDFFGAHTYRRVDADGSFHTDWQSE